MTDEESEAIGKEVRKALHFDLTDVRAVEWGRAAVEAVTKRLRTDVPSVGEIKKRMLDSWRSGAGSSLVENDARVAHAMMLELQRPACTAPVVDPDAEAKRLCWVHYSAVWPYAGDGIENVWSTQTTEGKNGWRAVAAAKGGEDE